MVGNLYFCQVIFAKKIWMSTYLPCRETISFYISNIIELPSQALSNELRQVRQRDTFGMSMWFIKVFKCIKNISCYLAADTDKSSVCIGMTNPTAQISTSDSYCFLDESYEKGLALFL